MRVFAKTTMNENINALDLLRAYTQTFIADAEKRAIERGWLLFECCIRDGCDVVSTQFNAITGEWVDGEFSGQSFVDFYAYAYRLHAYAAAKKVMWRLIDTSGDVDETIED